MPSFRWGRFNRTLDVAKDAIAQGLVPGLVAGAFELKAGGHTELIWIGSRRLTPTPQPMERDTVFDWASLTKSLCTAPLIWRAIQRGWITEHSAVSAVLPDAPASWRGMTIGHLLSHSAGFKAWAPIWQELVQDWGGHLPEVLVGVRQAEFRARVMREELEVAPGMRTLYSDFSFLVLGFVLEHLHGAALDRIWRREMPGIGAGFRRVHRPAGAAQPRDSRVAATEDVAWRGGVLQGEVHDENCWSMGGFAGHAGLFGTMQDLWEVSRRIFDSRFLDDALRARMFAPVRLEAPGASGPVRTLGWDLPSGPDSSAGPTLSSHRGVVGHLGFTGTSLWIDTQSGFGFALLTGRVHLGREHIGIRTLRPRIHEAMALDVGLAPDPGRT